MFKSLISFTLIFSFLFTNAQTGIKDKTFVGVHLLTGYVSIPAVDDLNAKLIANNFGTVVKNQFDVGALFNLVAKGSIIKLQFELTLPKSGSKTYMSTSSLQLCIGHDILSKSDKTMIYPFLGFKFLEYTVTGESAAGEKLNALKPKYCLSTGLGLFHFYTPHLIKRILNQVDLNTGVNFGLISEKWKSDGSQFVEGTFHKNLNYFITLSFGYGSIRN